MSYPETIIFPVEKRDFVEISSADAARFLHNYCTADINKMADGAVVEAFFPSDKGRILAYGLIERRDESFLISGSPGTAETLIPHLSKYAVLDGVSVTDVTTEWSTFILTGDDGRTVCEKVLGGSTARFFETLEASELCIRVVVAAADTDSVRNGFLSARVSQASEVEREFVRIAAGVPAVGIDVSDANLVQEAARTRIAVSFTKGCYLGQEPIARLDAMGHTNRELRTIEFSADADVEVGAEVFDGEKAVGTVTSTATAFDKTVVLAVLRKSVCDVGAEVTVGASVGRVAHAEEAMAAAGRLAN